MKISVFIFSLFSLSGLCASISCTEKISYIDKAETILDSIYSHYSVKGHFLLRETYPFNETHKATYLDNEEQMKQKNPYSYLWPFSGSLSAVTALYEVEKNPEYLYFLENTVLPGLEKYYDTRRSPDAYASYIRSAPLSDRFYDDNIWIGLDFTDLYLSTGDRKYLDKAESVWKFIVSGTDDKSGGGIYWCEQNKKTKNTCSNAPGAVYALKLFEATKDSSYFYQGKKLYLWTKKNLQDPVDHLYFDNIDLNGNVDERKFAYNSGQMMQAASLLYKFTGEEAYLKDSQKLGEACYRFFFSDFEDAEGNRFRLLKKWNVWFTGIMFRGFVELYKQDDNRMYIDAFQKNLDYAWNHMREADGLFGNDWSGKEKKKSKWLLTQFAMVEMYARISNL